MRPRLYSDAGDGRVHRAAARRRSPLGAALENETRARLAPAGASQYRTQSESNAGSPTPKASLLSGGGAPLRRQMGH